jgi:hypothetical protein
MQPLADATGTHSKNEELTSDPDVPVRLALVRGALPAKYRPVHTQSVISSSSCSFAHPLLGKSCTPNSKKISFR